MKGLSPHRRLLLWVLLTRLFAGSAIAVWVLPFTSWEDLTEKSTDIIIARCTKTAEPRIVSDHMITTEIEVLFVLKGGTKTGPAQMVGGYQPQQGERFLLFAHYMKQADGMKYTAAETYRAVPLGLSYPVEAIKDLPLETQVRNLLRHRLQQLKQEAETRAEEVRRLEKDWAGRTPGPEPDHLERANWEARVQRVQQGMRRAEVERLLPPYMAIAGEGLLPYSGQSALLTGGSQTISYYVSPGWRVSIPYDYTGITSGKAEGPDRYNSPDNRVIGPATLSYLLEIHRLTFDAKNLHAGIRHQGRIVDGARWRDLNGENILVLAQSGEEADSDKGVKSAELYAHHYLLKDDVPTLLWSLVDFVRDCEFDLALHFIPNSLQITDLDQDGIGESLLVYRQSCTADVSPAVQKLVLHEGNDKYAIRGTEYLAKMEAGGDMEADASFDKSGRAFKDFAIRHWRRFAGVK
jgi:hypothetical protein